MLDPLVLLPGLQSDHRSWHYQIQHFGGKRPLIVPEGQQYCDSIEAMADVVLEQLPARCHLAAWSMGGYIALAAMPRFRERLISLILVDTSARPEDPASTNRRKSLLELAEREGIVAAAIVNSTQSALHAGALPLELRQSLVSAWDDFGVEAYRGQQNAIMQRPDTRANLALIDCPTLIVVGEADTTTPPECSYELQAGIDGSELHVIDKSGHCVPYEQPHAFNVLVEQWLARHQSRAV
ncbi:alpha/beta hydrolase [Devosia sp.]|uniref:alpha/beta fold hydrolase n=1 Tax=Devosia sp. TaxID=1871048 RepID=UPI001AD3A578|nr:alpha/beta hydrolase [Devosia sp.]MBN9334641.1 alpha/beta hydrolase [Devosia sp.]